MVCENSGLGRLSQSVGGSVIEWPSQVASTGMVLSLWCHALEAKLPGLFACWPQVSERSKRTHTRSPKACS